MTESDHSQRTAEFWNERHQDPEGEAHDNFLSHELVQAYMSLRAFGSVVGQIQTIRYEILKRTKPGSRILSVGCGLAEKERFFAEKLPDREFVALDLADRIVQAGRAENERRGITNLEIGVGDFNDLELEADAFDLVLGMGAIHHIEQLEHFWASVAKCLRPGGVLIAQEYIGTSRFQWTDAQIEAGNRALREIVPRAHQVHHQEVERPSVEAMIAIDPSEAVRSAEIIPTAHAAGFNVTGFCSGGGALLQPVLMYQISTFDQQNWSHNRILAQLFEEEDRLMAAGVLTDDFAMFLAEPPQ